jgi:hypothetical protein
VFLARLRALWVDISARAHKFLANLAQDGLVIQNSALCVAGKPARKPSVVEKGSGEALPPNLARDTLATVSNDPTVN